MVPTKKPPLYHGHAGELKKAVHALAAQNAEMLTRLDELEKGFNVATLPVSENKKISKASELHQKIK